MFGSFFAISALDRKLLRDLVRLRGQVITIALVVACGIAAFVTLQTTWASLNLSKDSYYDRYRFADVFVHLERAPQGVAKELEAIPFVSRVNTRIVKTAMVPLASLEEPISATLVSVPATEPPLLNAIHLRKGRYIEPGHADEAVLIDTFAEAHHLELNDRVPLIVNGTRREFRIVGTALSPEFVFPMSPTDMAPDAARFAVLWIDQAVLSPAFQLDGAFNDVLMKLENRRHLPEVLARTDEILRPYGGLGTVGRDKQFSNFTLEGELSQLKAQATVVPIIFLGVAAFLLNVVLSRLVYLQRTEIAVLKAVGYRDRQIGLHFLKLVLLIVLVGAMLGVSLGAYLGEKFVAYYGIFFHFAVFVYRLDGAVVSESVFISTLSAIVGALGAVRSVSRLPPAEAMRPPPPTNYRPTLLERLGVFRLLGPAPRMVLREVQRRPIRVLLSSLGIAMAIGIMVIGQFWTDAMDFMMDVQFHSAMRENLSVAFTKATSPRSIRDLGHLPGVIKAEGLRMVPVRFRRGPRYRDSAIFGYPDGCDLRRVVDQRGVPVSPPDNGVMLTRKLADILGASPGDVVEVDVREGERATRTVTVAAVVEEVFGLQGHMRMQSLHQLLREQEAVSMGMLSVDKERLGDIRGRLKKMRQVASVTRLDNMRERFEQQSGTMMIVITALLTTFATVIAVGVIYNNARIALSMRSRDLASLRVLGFTKAEIATILFGELGIQVILALPMGLWFGTFLSKAMLSTMDPETYRMPVVISMRSYAIAVMVAIGSAVLSALLIRHKLEKLDLIGVLKTRE